LLERLASPLNLRFSQSPRYASQLLNWRRRYFPRNGTF
jgi:hypothetical protein